MSVEKVVVAGAGHGAGAFAATLVQAGFKGTITLVGDEAMAPYQRPPLSKGWITGKVGGDDLLLKPDHFYADRNIALRLGETVTAIDRQAKTATLSGGDTLPWDAFVLATGARARKLPLSGADLAGVYYLRGVADAEAIKAALETGKSLVVIGGGYIGLEVAASARLMGLSVTVVERESRLLARVASAPLSAFMEARHRAQGVEFIFEAHVSGLQGEAGHVTAVTLGHGDPIPADVVLVGIGAIPNEDIAKAAGLECDGGVVVDEDGRTSDPDIYAIGDVAHRTMPIYGRTMRLESVPSALELGRLAAYAIVGKARPAPEVPWFWSDQYTLKLQMAGIPFDVDEVIHRGDADSDKISVFHLREGQLQAVECVNATQEFLAGRKLIGSGNRLDIARLADAAVPLKDAVLA